MIDHELTARMRVLQTADSQRDNSAILAAYERAISEGFQRHYTSGFSGTLSAAIRQVLIEREIA